MSNVITASMLDWKISGITLDITASVKPDKASTTKKTVTLRVNYNGIALRDVFGGDLEDVRIAWANGGSGRKNFANIVDRSVIEVDRKSPGAKVETREERIAKFEGILGDHDLAVMAVDNPEGFRALMAKVDKKK